MKRIIAGANLLLASPLAAHSGLAADGLALGAFGGYSEWEGSAEGEASSENGCWRSSESALIC